MDIRDWPLDKIMQLPDHYFGRRWPVGLQAELGDADPVFDICEASLSEVCVIWDLRFSVYGSLAASVEYSLAIGDQLPANDAQFNALEQVFPCVESRSGRRSSYEQHRYETFVFCSLRFPLRVSGRRFVGRFIRIIGGALGAQAIITVSSIPKEIPDCLFSV